MITRSRQNERKHSAVDILSLLGLFTVTAMLMCYAVEDRGTWF
jgi:hypothetical protein